MSRHWFAVAACVIALGIAGSAQGPSSDTAKAFNGTSLSGWKPQGAAQWKVAGGEIVGSAASGGGLLVLAKSYQDIILKFAFQCDNCDAGVALRHAALPAQPGTTTALYVGLSGPDARTLHRVSLDAQGKELERTNLYKWIARQNPPGMQLLLTPGTGGWTHVRIQVRGDVTAPAAGGRGNAATAPAAAGSPRLHRRPPRLTDRCRYAWRAATCGSKTSRLRISFGRQPGSPRKSRHRHFAGFN